MPKRSTGRRAGLDDVFRALSDGCRRAMVERLTHGPASVSQLAEPFDMALPTIVQHLQVLEQAGIVTSEKVGRVRTYQLAADALVPANAWIVARRRTHRPHGGPLLIAGIFATGIYGGYFGAGQGILLFGLLATALGGDLRHVNAIRAVLAGTANFVAAVVFLFIADIAWLPAVLIAVGATAGGLFGAGVGRRLSDPWLRAIIVVVGLAAIAQLVL